MNASEQGEAEERAIIAAAWNEINDLEASPIDPLSVFRTALFDLNRRLAEIESFLVISKETGR